MSATNRGTERNERDFYPTPLSAFEPLIPYLPWGVTILEPACGDGRLVEAMNHCGLSAAGCDLKHGYNFLTDTDHWPCIVTNPPFSLAFEFCKHAVKHSSETFLLLRLNFLASKKRSEWFKANPPDALFVLTSRPSFTGKGTDACDYAWFYWGLKHNGIYFL